jgi:exoribonuclease-2
VPGLEAQLRCQDAVAQAMKALRHRRGALSLEGIEARAVFDGDALADLRPDESNRAKQLIEDFMIAANGVTARFLEERGVAYSRSRQYINVAPHVALGFNLLGDGLRDALDPRLR